MGEGDSAVGADGSADGRFDATVVGPVIYLELWHTDASGNVLDTDVYDTIPYNGRFVLGVSTDGGSTLLNTPTGGVPALPNGTHTFALYGASSYSYANDGSTYWQLRAHFSDGSIAYSQPTRAIPCPPGSGGPGCQYQISSFTVPYLPTPQDEVAGGEPGIGADGSADGRFDATIIGPVTDLEVWFTDATGTVFNGAIYDTIAGNGRWVLGVSTDGGSTLLNTPSGSIPAQPSGTHTFALYGASSYDYANDGSTYWQLRAHFADGSVVYSQPTRAIAACPLGSAGASCQNQISSFTIPYLPTPQDEVTGGEPGIGADGSADGRFDATIVGPVTDLEVWITDVNGVVLNTLVYDTIAGNGRWVLGVSTDGGSTLLNTPSGSIPAQPSGTHTFALYGASSYSYANDGSTYWQLRAHFADGSIAFSPAAHAF
ncbi:MAG: hypothetical protein QM820_39430 [Minicystis sp.]